MQNLNLKGTSILEALKSANNLMKDSKQKALLIMSDGGDKKDFSKEIEYAKSHHIRVFVYATATKKGGVLKVYGQTMKDAKGNIVILRRDDAIKKLALSTGGAYMPYSLNSKDMKELAKILESSLAIDKSEDVVIHNREELFYYPLILALILIFVSSFSMPKRRES